MYGDAVYIFFLKLGGCVQFFCSTGHRLNVMMETKGGKKSNLLQYEAPLGYKIEDVRPHGGIEKFHSAAYFNCARKPS